MQHPDEGRGQEPATNEEPVPDTVWTRYRESGVPSIALAALLVAGGAHLMREEWLTFVGLLAAAFAAAAVIPALVLEYRADRAYHRAHPATARTEVDQ